MALSCLAGEGLAHAPRLPPPGVVQLDVELALDARIHVPGRLAMPHGNDASGFHAAHCREGFTEPKPNSCPRALRPTGCPRAAAPAAGSGSPAWPRRTWPAALLDCPAAALVGRVRLVHDPVRGQLAQHHGDLAPEPVRVPVGPGRAEAEGPVAAAIPQRPAAAPVGVGIGREDTLAAGEHLHGVARRRIVAPQAGAVQRRVRQVLK
jgi:hypothetical protein